MKASLPNPVFNYDDRDSWPPLLPLFVVARILYVSPWTLRQWDKQGILVPLRLGDRKDRRYKKEDIVKVLKEGIKGR